MTQRDRNAGNRYSGRQELSSEEFEQSSDARGDTFASTTGRPNQMQQDAPGVRSGMQRPPSRGKAQQGSVPSPSQHGGGQFGSHAGAQPSENRGGGSWRPGEDADAQDNGPGYRSGESENQHPGQLGYSQGGGVHDNWGAFEGSQQRQSPGYGQDEPWQHYHDADYLRWREEHLRQLDEEYATWRRERYGKFSEEFSQWRSSRQRMAEDDAENPRQAQDTDKGGSEEQRTSLHGKLK